MLAVNFLITSISIWLIIFLNQRFLQPALKNKQRFELYKLRDELSLLAMNGSLDENSEKYRILINVINSTIRATGSFKVSDYIRFILNFQNDRALNKKIDSIMEKIDQSDDKEYCRIASNVFQVMHEILHSDTRTLRYFFFPVFCVVGGVLSLIKVTAPKKLIEKNQDVFREMNEALGKYSHQFSKICVG